MSRGGHFFLQAMGFCIEARNRRGVAGNMEGGVTEVQELWKKWHFRQSVGQTKEHTCECDQLHNSLILV